MRGFVKSDAKVWKERAEKVRMLAGAIEDQQSRARMMSVAAAYESMAVHAESRALPGQTDIAPEPSFGPEACT